MGLFSTLRRLFSSTPPRVQENHKVWMTQAAKVRGIASGLQQITNGPCFVITHFPNTFDGMQSLLDGMRLEFSLVEHPVSADDVEHSLLDRNRRIILTRAEFLPSITDPPNFEDENDATVSLIAVEHHPLAKRDAHVRQFAAGLPIRATLQLHAALDDIVLRAFAGERVAEVLKTLGMKENEPIESNLVRRRIISAQKRLAAAAIDDQPASSAEEWMAKNCPALLPKSAS